MRALADDRAELIEAVVAGSAQSGLTLSLLEKDEHLTDALRAVFSLQFECVELVFAGGTSLSKAHGLIERMSEDADLKMVLTEAGQRLSRSALKRYLAQEVRGKVGRAMSEIGLVEDTERGRVLNEYRYMHSQWSYQRRYPAGPGLRPTLQLELTLRKPQLVVVPCRLRALVDRLTSREGVSCIAPTVSVAETLAEKVLSFLRRFAQHRAGRLQRDWDTALVRHIYDVHCIVTQRPALVELSATAFAALTQGDVAEFGRQHPEFGEAPFRVMAQALMQIGNDRKTRTEYATNLLPLVYGTFKPPFDEAFHSFQTVALRLMNTPPAA